MSVEIQVACGSSPLSEHRYGRQGTHRVVIGGGFAGATMASPKDARRHQRRPSLMQPLT
jgi:hypothetical protein